MSAPARRVYLSFPPGWDRMSEEQKREAALGIARAMQRALLQYKKPGNRVLVREALIAADRRDLIGDGPRCLIRS